MKTEPRDWLRRRWEIRRRERLARRRRALPRIVALTSLIDVVFLLLIFFVVTARYQPDEKALGSDLPRGQGAAATLKTTPEEIEPVVLRVQGSGEFYSLVLGERSCTGYDDLLANLRGLRRSGESRVLIAADEKVRFKYVVRALNVARHAGFEQLAFQSP